jgi:hypothetical protein
VLRRALSVSVEIGSNCSKSMWCVECKTWPNLVWSIALDGELIVNELMLGLS